MLIGDLVHAPHYPFWGLGMIVDLEDEESSHDFSQEKVNDLTIVTL